MRRIKLIKVVLLFYSLGASCSAFLYLQSDIYSQRVPVFCDTEACRPLWYRVNCKVAEALCCSLDYKKIKAATLQACDPLPGPIGRWCCACNGAHFNQCKSVWAAARWGLCAWNHWNFSKCRLCIRPPHGRWVHWYIKVALSMPSPTCALCE